MEPPILRFTDEYRFLSNFYPSPIEFEGHTYPTVEHAYQAAKTINPVERLAICHARSAADAKSRGRHVRMRPDWDRVRVPVMAALLRRKFRVGTSFAAQLLATGDRELVEGNTWGDRFWGHVGGKGRNHLGRLLMQQRSVLREEVQKRAEM